MQSQKPRITVKLDADTTLAAPKRQGKNNRTKQLLTTLVILLIFPVLYYQGVINEVWTNRIGIIFNFIAGFLVSPELLFRSNSLLRTEQSIRAFSKKTQDTFDKLQLRIRNWFNDFTQGEGITFTGFLATAFFAICIVIGYGLWGNFFNFILLPLMYVFCLPIIFVYMIFLITKGKFKKEEWLKYLVVTLIMPALFPVFIISYPILSIALLSISLISGITSQILQILTNDGGLRALLVWIGILLFVIGNALQLMATF